MKILNLFRDLNVNHFYRRNRRKYFDKYRNADQNSLINPEQFNSFSVPSQNHHMRVFDPQSS